MSSTEQYPARVEHFHEVEVTFYEIDGKEYLSGEDIGRCLGMTNPKKAVSNIYSRNRQELEGHKGTLKLRTPGGEQDTSVFTETGANLIGMFARTPKAKEFRLWLARLPRRVRQLAQGDLSRQLLAEGVRKGFILASDLMAGKVNRDDLARLWWWRLNGATQKEVSLLLDLSRDQVQVMEKRLAELGLKFPAVNANQRLRQMKEAFTAAISEIPPGPPLSKGGVKELAHDAPAG